MHPTTAHHEPNEAAEAKTTVMSNDNLPGSIEEKIIENGYLGNSTSLTPEHHNASLNHTAKPLETLGKNTKAFEANDEAGHEGSSRSDSEAETVVPFDKDEPSVIERKAFRHGSESLPKTTVTSGTKHKSAHLTKESALEANVSHKSLEDGANPEKDLAVPGDTNNSSNLSSTHSSPTQPTHSPTQNGVESPRQQFPPDEVRSRKRKRRNPSVAEDLSRRRTSSTHGTKPQLKAETEFLEPSRPSLPGNLKTRSGSPQAHGGLRSSDSTQYQQTTKRRKAPPPLSVNHVRKGSEDGQGESDDSASVRAPNHLRRLVSLDGAAMSPAKTPHKKLRDRNGRTQLARACAIDEVGPVEARLAERPQDLDIADNAGNTPLQIASLEGHADIVRILLKARCDIHCKNSDFDTPLIDAVENGHLDVVKLLLNAGLDPRQTNATGEEPLDLLRPDNDNYEEIRAVLIEAKTNDGKRRLSEDHQSVTNKTKDSGSPTSPRGSPTFHSTRSPPPHHPSIPRRRTARSEATRNDVLWIHATPENLRDKAGRGDVQRVGYILNMGTPVDIETVLCAARGGHRDVLDLLIAMGQPDADPNPLRDHKYGFNTPMLAAIGRGNVDVVSLLLNQRGFDPTRRLWEGKTYYEIAKERQGPCYQEEYKILKEAYDRSKGGKSSSKSPQQFREKKSKRIITSSPSREEAKSQLADGVTEPSKPRKSVQSEARKDSQRNGHDSKKHLQVPSHGSRDSSVAVSDQEVSSTSPAGRILKRSSSNKTLPAAEDKEAIKPRRKLVSGKELKSNQDHKRRASLMSNASSSSSNHHREHKAEERSTVKAKEEASTGSSEADVKAPIKRIRKVSTSPQSNDDTRLRRKSSDVVQKVKRRRVDSNGKAIEAPIQGDAPTTAPPVANMIKQPIKKPSLVVSSGNAPVAVMGKAPASPSASPLKTTPDQSPRSPSNMPHIDGQEKYVQDLRDLSMADQTLLRQQKLKREHSHPDDPTRRSSPNSTSHATKQGLTPSPSDNDPREASERMDLNPVMLEEIIRQENERKAEEEAQRKAQEEKRRQEEERERQKRRELLAKQQADLERLRKEAARRVEIQKAEEAEREAQAARDEENARQEKQAREEEQKRRRAELERHRREEQEKRRIEQEEYEQMQRVFRQKEEERRKRELLPNGLRRIAELPADRAKSIKEIKRWLPLYTITSQQLGMDQEHGQEKWIANIQAAPVLGVGDLGLAQCMEPHSSRHHVFHMLTYDLDTAWTKLPATPTQRISLWRILRCKLSYVEQPPFQFPDPHEDIARDKETQVKFEALEQVFWIRLSEFNDIAARLQHLTHVDLKCAPMALEKAPPTPTSTSGGELAGNGPLADEKTSPGLTNGGVNLVNGWH